jgi:hypothetical protein
MLKSNQNDNLPTQTAINLIALSPEALPAKAFRHIRLSPIFSEQSVKFRTYPAN